VIREEDDDEDTNEQDETLKMSELKTPQEQPNLSSSEIPDDVSPEKEDDQHEPKENELI
jgi:hypothetical protein